MKALVLLVLGIALVDGLNPSTIGPALVLAVRQRGVVLVSMFTVGVFVPSLAQALAPTRSAEERREFVDRLEEGMRRRIASAPAGLWPALPSGAAASCRA